MLYFYSIWICAAFRVFLWWDFNEICLSGGAIEWLWTTAQKSRKNAPTSPSDARGRDAVVHGSLWWVFVSPGLP